MMLAAIHNRFAKFLAPEKSALRERLSAYTNHPLVEQASQRMQKSNSELVVGISWLSEERFLMFNTQLVNNLVITSSGLRIRQDVILPDSEREKKGQIACQLRVGYLQLKSDDIAKLPDLNCLAGLITQNINVIWGRRNQSVRIISKEDCFVPPGVYALDKDLMFS